MIANITNDDTVVEDAVSERRSLLVGSSHSSSSSSASEAVVVSDEEYKYESESKSKSECTILPMKKNPVNNSDDERILPSIPILLRYQCLMFVLTFVNFGVLHATRSVWSATTKEFILHSTTDTNHDNANNTSIDTNNRMGGDTALLSETDVARLNSTFLAFYSLGMFFTGQLADRYHHQLRYLILVLYGLIAAIMVTIGALLLWMIPSNNNEEQNQHNHNNTTVFVGVLYLLKALNGLLQSPSWAIHIVLLSNWFPKTRRGLLLGVWGCSAHVGNIIGAQAFQYFGSVDDLGSPFFGVAAIVGASGLLSSWLLVEMPDDVGIIILNDENKSDSDSDSDNDIDNRKSIDDDYGNGNAVETTITTITTTTNYSQNSTSINNQLSPSHSSTLPPLLSTPIKAEHSRRRRHNIHFWQAVAVPGVIEFSICFFFAKLVQKAMYYWIIVYLQTTTTPDDGIGNNNNDNNNNHESGGGLGYDSNTAITIFSWYEIGGLFGSIALGLLSDLLPIRTPVYLLATLASAVLVILLGQHHHHAYMEDDTIEDDNKNTSQQQQQQQFWLTVNLFALGAVLNGKSLVVAAIECDMGNWIRRTRNLEALGTFAGMIDGFASVGGIASQSVFLAAKNQSGWTGAFSLLGLFLVVSLLPAIRFLFFELRLFREEIK